MSKQLLRSETQVGALIREARNAESRKDFIHKLGIAQKLAVYDNTDQVLKMIKSSIITTKKNTLK